MFDCRAASRDFVLPPFLLENRQQQISEFAVFGAGAIQKRLKPVTTARESQRLLKFTMTEKLKCSLQRQVSRLKIRRVDQIADKSVRLRMLHLQQQLDCLQLSFETGVGEEWVVSEEWFRIGKLHRCAWCLVIPDGDRRGGSIQMKERMDELRPGIYLSNVAAREQRNVLK